PAEVQSSRFKVESPKSTFQSAIENPKSAIQNKPFFTSRKRPPFPSRTEARRARPDVWQGTPRRPHNKSSCSQAARNRDLHLERQCSQPASSSCAWQPQSDHFRLA